MWSDWVMPRLRERGVGRDVASQTFRLTGIGESAVAELLGETLFRGRNPIVATYVRADAIDIRISAVAADGRSAHDLVTEAAGPVLESLRPHVWATGEATWADVVGNRLGELDWTLATAEAGTGGALVALLGELPMLVEATETLVLPRPRFRELIASEPALRDALLAALTAELRRLTTHVQELHFLDITGRLAARLSRLGQTHGAPGEGGTIRLDGPLTQSDLAAMIGATRQSVNKLLGLFVDDGLLRLERDAIIILDRDGLDRMSRR